MLTTLKSRWDARVASPLRNLDEMLSLRRALLALRQRRLRRAATSDLEALSDELLTDIGISRADIPDVVERMIAADARSAAAESPARPATPPALLRRAA